LRSARYNRTSFSPIGDGFDFPVRCAVVHNNDLIAGGSFANSGSTPVSLIARFSACPACIGDIAPPGGNGSVGVPDLLAVINSWGSCGPPCAADIAPPGGNGTVGVPDLLAVINSWGQCM
jgi:hypothetical protein